jgi:hypothetical protein
MCNIQSAAPLPRSTKKSPSVSTTALRALRTLVERAPHALQVGKVVLKDFATFITLLKLMQRNVDNAPSLVSGTLLSLSLRGHSLVDWNTVLLFSRNGGSPNRAFVYSRTENFG